MSKWRVFSDDEISASRNKLESIKEESLKYDEPERGEFIVKSLESCSKEELLMMIGLTMSERV